MTGRPSKVLTLLLLACVGCASAHPPISNGAASQLGAQVAQVRITAASGDLAGAEQRLSAVRQSVADLLKSGQLSQSRAGSILAAAEDVGNQLTAITTTTTSTTTTPPPPTEPVKHPIKPSKGGDGGGQGGGGGGGD